MGTNAAVSLNFRAFPKFQANASSLFSQIQIKALELFCRVLKKLKAFNIFTLLKLFEDINTNTIFVEASVRTRFLVTLMFKKKILELFLVSGKIRGYRRQEVF